MRQSQFRSKSFSPAPAFLAALLPFATWFAPAIVKAAAATADAAQDTGLEEITVTAEKYKSTIQNTPISLSALSGEQLDSAGITSVEAMAREVPGLSVRSAGPGETEYEARGLASNGGAAPTVGFYLDEVPLSPPALAQAGKVVIDPNLFDVARIAKSPSVLQAFAALERENAWTLDQQISLCEIAAPPLGLIDTFDERFGTE